MLVPVLLKRFVQRMHPGQRAAGLLYQLSLKCRDDVFIL
jgi:hypothetical protein